MSSTSANFEKIKEFITETRKTSDEQHASLLARISEIENEIAGAKSAAEAKNSAAEAENSAAEAENFQPGVLQTLQNVAPRGAISESVNFVIFGGEDYTVDSRKPAFGERGCRDIRVFKEKIYKEEPVLRHIDLKQANLVIAGGFVCAQLGSSTLEKDCYGDIDLFMIKPAKGQNGYELTPEHRAFEAVRYVQEALVLEHGGYRNGLPEINPTTSVRMFRTAVAVTFVVNVEDPDNRDGPFHTLKLQIILKEYTNVERLLSGFDIDPAGVAYDGENVLFTKGAVVAHETGYMKHKSSFTRASVNRFEKYYERGWGMWFPGTTTQQVIKGGALSEVGGSRLTWGSRNTQILSVLTTLGLTYVNCRYFTVGRFDLIPCTNTDSNLLVDNDYYGLSPSLRYHPGVLVEKRNMLELAAGRECIWAVDDTLTYGADCVEPDSRAINRGLIEEPGISILQLRVRLKLITNGLPELLRSGYITALLSCYDNGKYLVLNTAELYDKYIESYAKKYSIPFVVETDPVSPTVENVASDKELYASFYVSS
jgi:hypothetical protein